MSDSTTQSEDSVDPMAKEFRYLADDLLRERVQRASRIPESKRIEMGPQLFDWAVKQALAAIRFQNPGSDETEVRRILHERMLAKRKLDEHGIYIDVEETQ